MWTRLCCSEKNLQWDDVFKDKDDLCIAGVRTVTEVNVPAVKNILNLQFECQLRCLRASELFGVCWSGRQDSNRPQLDCLLCIKPHRRLLEEMKRILCTFQSCSSAHLLQLLSSLACSRGLGGLLVGHNRVAVVLACSVVSFAEVRSSILGRLLQPESPQSGVRYRSSCRPGRVHQLISIWMRWHSSTLRK